MVNTGTTQGRKEMKRQESENMPVCNRRRYAIIDGAIYYVHDLIRARFRAKYPKADWISANEAHARLQGAATKRVARPKVAQKLGI